MKRIKLSLAYLTLRHVIYERVSSLFTIIAVVNEARNANAREAEPGESCVLMDLRVTTACKRIFFFPSLFRSSLLFSSRRITRADSVGAVGRKRKKGSSQHRAQPRARIDVPRRVCKFLTEFSILTAVQRNSVRANMKFVR